MTGFVRLDARVEAEALFDYLADPTRRPDWQSSLRAVTDLRGTGDVGSSWRDVTVVGVRPALRVTEFERPYTWAESGRWAGLRADLRLDLAGYAAGRTRLTAAFGIAGTGLWALPAAVLQRLAGPAIEADLRRAVRLAAAG